MLPIQPIPTFTAGDVFRQFLILIKAGNAPQIPPVDWQIENVPSNFMPEEPDNFIGVSDTQGRILGSLQLTGETVEQFGVQIRIRARSPQDGNKRGMYIRSIIERISNDQITLINDETKRKETYVIASASHKGLINLGLEKTATTNNKSNRTLYSINALVWLGLV